MIRIFWLSVILIAFIFKAIKTIVHKVLKQIFKYVAHMTYEWCILVLVACIYINVAYPNWSYVDYIWMSPIASLMILLIFETFTTPDISMQHYNKPTELCENF